MVRYMPLHAVTCRHVPSHAVTWRYLPLGRSGSVVRAREPRTCASHEEHCRALRLTVNRLLWTYAHAHHRTREVVTHTEVVAISADGVTLRKGRECAPPTDTPIGGSADAAAAAEEETYDVAADVVLWAAGSRPNSLLESLGLPLDERGR